MLFHMATHGYCTNLPALGTFSILTLTLLQKAVWRPSSPSQSPLSSSVVLGAGMSMSFDRAKQPRACQLPMAIWEIIWVASLVTTVIAPVSLSIINIIGPDTSRYCVDIVEMVSRDNSVRIYGCQEWKYEQPSIAVRQTPQQQLDVLSCFNSTPFRYLILRWIGRNRDAQMTVITTAQQPHAFRALNFGINLPIAAVKRRLLSLVLEPANFQKVPEIAVVLASEDPGLQPEIGLTISSGLRVFDQTFRPFAPPNVGVQRYIRWSRAHRRLRNSPQPTQQAAPRAGSDPTGAQGEEHTPNGKASDTWAGQPKHDS